MEVPRNESVRPPQGSQAELGQLPYGPPRPRRKIILCFDGTGNKFTGKDSDSNILKIYRMLDRNNGDKHYYQPGIGTYVKGSLSHTSALSRAHSWLQKAKDSAVGTSFDEHVMGAYKFLMTCYDNDDIYFFGFSRGAYAARFLAEMLDHVGLLSQGNEEMARFAWKAFANWQRRDESTEEEKAKKQEMLEFLQSFRDTFSRPVRRIRFLGLFDTVNSVPRFESAWMQRSKFPYTARSSAKVIRHAVSIDERRAKFRSDLITSTKKKALSNNDFRPEPHADGKRSNGVNGGAVRSASTAPDRFRRKSHVDLGKTLGPQIQAGMVEKSNLDASGKLMEYAGSPRRNASNIRLDGESIRSGGSSYLPAQIPTDDDDDEKDESTPQDVEELWFPGGHGDLGGGWVLDPTDTPLSLVPLIWMVREAQRAGLDFDSEQMLKLKCCDDNLTMNDEMCNEEEEAGQRDRSDKPARPPMPDIQITGDSSNDIFNSPKREKSEPGWAPGFEPPKPRKSQFHQTLEHAMTKSTLHDVLLFGNGLTKTQVMAWKCMEYMPFRRMDLRPDGSWKAISLPLPMGETRDIPEDAHIHHSAILRMKADPSYRPGNLIIGGGGRGVRKAPKELGMGNWEVHQGDGDLIGCIYIRKGESANEKIGRGELPKMEDLIDRKVHEEKKPRAMLSV